MKLLILITALSYSLFSYAVIPGIGFKVKRLSNTHCFFNITGKGDVYSSFKAPCEFGMEVRTYKDGRPPIVTIVKGDLPEEFFENTNNVYVSDEVLLSDIAIHAVRAGVDPGPALNMGGSGTYGTSDIGSNRVSANEANFSAGGKLEVGEIIGWSGPDVGPDEIGMGDSDGGPGDDLSDPANSDDADVFDVNVKKRD